MRTTKRLLAAVLTVAAATPHPLLADDTTELIQSLKQQLQALEQKVKILERNRELDEEASAEKAKSTPTVSLGASGLQVRSADSNFVFNIHGYIQADGRFGVGESAGPYPNTFLLRRVRPIFDGSLYKWIDYKVMLDFASGVTSSGFSTTSASNDGFVQDAYANLKFLPELQLQIGKMKEPVGLERLQSGANLLFVERGFPTLLVPNRDVGAMLQGGFLSQRLTYQAGIFNGVADGGSADFQNFNDGFNFAGRLFGEPFKGGSIEPLEGFGLGVAGTVGDLNGPVLRSYVSPGQQTVFSYLSGTVADGNQWRITPQGYYYWGPFGLFGEYVVSSQQVFRPASGATPSASGTLVNSAWQVAASWFLTGERNSWKPVAPRNPFSLEGGGWGAWEIAARIQGLNPDQDAFPNFASSSKSVKSAFSWGVGVNWYLNRNVKLSLDYEQTQFSGGQNNVNTAQDEQLIFTQLQLSF